MLSHTGRLQWSTQVLKKSGSSSWDYAVDRLLCQAQVFILKKVGNGELLNEVEKMLVTRAKRKQASYII